MTDIKINSSIFNLSDILPILCKEKNLFGMLLTIEDDEMKEYQKCVPYLTLVEFTDLFMNGFIILFFDSEEEMNKAYNHTVGDDGPTDFNQYQGPARIYALTCSNKGKLWNENT